MAIKFVEKQVRHFLSTCEPSVLCIKGKWGTGKTYAWNKWLAAAKGEEQGIGLAKYCYASLFGISSLAELKMAVFANTVNKSIIGEAPSLKSLDANMAAQFKAAGRKSFSFIVDYAIGKRAPSLDPVVASLFINNTLVCFDDLERRGEKVSLSDVLGFASELKERKGCKVVLIMNEDAETQRNPEYAAYVEKVVDEWISFEPNAREACEIGLGDDAPFRGMQAFRLAALNVTNIRIVQRLNRFIKHTVSVASINEDVAQRTIAVVAMAIWANFDNASQYKLEQLVNAWEGPWPEDAGNRFESRMFLQDYLGSPVLSDFDRMLIKGVTQGYVDIRQAMQSAERWLEQKRRDSRKQRFDQVYEEAVETLSGDHKDIAMKVAEAAESCIESLSPLDLQRVASLLRGSESHKQASAIILKYINARYMEFELLDLHRYKNADQVRDAEIREEFKRHVERSGGLDADEFRAILSKHLKTGTWQIADIKFLAEAPVEDYYRVLKQAGRSGRQFVKALLSIDKHVGSSSLTEIVISKTREALEIIRAENPLNNWRLSQYEDS